MQVQDIPSYGKDLVTCLEAMPARTKLKVALNALPFMAELIRALGPSGYRQMQRRVEEEWQTAMSLDWSHVVGRGAPQPMFESTVRGMVETKVRCDMLGLKRYEKMRNRLSQRVAYDIILQYYAPVKVFEACGDGDFLKPFTQHNKAMFEANEALGIDRAEFVEETEDTMQFNVVYCAVYEIAKALGNPYLCYISGCYGDNVFFPRFCAEAGFEYKRQGTLALGAPFCDTRFERIKTARP
jgi:hypothetical protein